MRDNPQIVRVLVLEGSSLRAQDELGRTPLATACNFGSRKATKELLFAGSPMLSSQEKEKFVKDLEISSMLAKMQAIQLVSKNDKN